MDDLDALLTELDECGVRQTGPDVGVIVEAAARGGLKVWRLDVGHASGKKDFLSAIAVALDFPKSFGGNWDAFVDCLRDLSWVDETHGYLIVLEKCDGFHKAHAEDFDAAADCLAEAAVYWKALGKPFWALLSGPKSWESGFEKLIL